jgi:hypothetical protein
MLEDRRARPAVREAIGAIGPAALAPLAAALADTGRPRPLRRSLPRTIGQLASRDAVAVLVARIPVEGDGAVMFRILRELSRLKSIAPELLAGIDRGPLERLADRTVRRILEVLGWRVALDGEPRAQPCRSVVGKLLAEKERQAIGRLFMILGILDPRAGYELVYGGLRAGDRQRHDAALEIIGNVLEPPRRDLVLDLVDDLPDRERLRRAGVRAPTPAEAIEAMAADHSLALQALVTYLMAREPSRSAS